jgi:hypothetical protein
MKGRSSSMVNRGWLRTFLRDDLYCYFYRFWVYVLQNYYNGPIQMVVHGMTGFAMLLLRQETFVCCNMHGPMVAHGVHILVMLLLLISI